MKWRIVGEEKHRKEVRHRLQTMCYFLSFLFFLKVLIKDEIENDDEGRVKILYRMVEAGRGLEEEVYEGMSSLSHEEVTEGRGTGRVDVQTERQRVGYGLRKNKLTSYC